MEPEPEDVVGMRVVMTHVEVEAGNVTVLKNRKHEIGMDLLP